MAGAVAAGLLLAHRRLGALAAAAALVMAFARVYVAAHSPWDVAAGLLVGSAVTCACWALLRVRPTSLTGWVRLLAGLRGAFIEQTDPPVSHQTKPTRLADRASGTLTPNR